MFLKFFFILLGTIAGMLAGAGVLHAIPRMGRAGQIFSQSLCRAPGLDFVVTYFTILPLVIGALAGGWIGLLAGVIGAVSGMLIWQFIHERMNAEAVKGPRIIKVLNRIVGRWRNITAVWITAIVTPMFWVVRMAQIFVYPPITWLVGLPAYNHAEWVNVSRHKFRGLVGHDLIWCLYCDWMTGVWSLGSEMLRNVESFWCPIRFDSEKKCANCSIDFPDINGGWVSANATMADVAQTLDAHYKESEPVRGWFGRPVPVTVKGKTVAEPTRGA